MTKGRDLVASVRQRLLNLSRERGEDFQLVLNRYGLERLLYRITQSAHAGQFVLKGAALFQLWTGQPHRATRDLDLLGQGDPSPDRLRQAFQDVCSVTVADDGLTFLTDAIRAEQIKEDDEYQGIRLRIDARLGNARIPLQIDIGFGDAITPGPQAVTYPTLLDFPAPQLQAYPRETVVAEKSQAMVHLGMANSRMKDFYDVWTLACQFEFDGPKLCAAIRATFERRQTALPEAVPLALTSEFGTDRQKTTQWNAFVRKGESSTKGVRHGEATEATGFRFQGEGCVARAEDSKRTSGAIRGSPDSDPPVEEAALCANIMPIPIVIE